MQKLTRLPVFATGSVPCDYGLSISSSLTSSLSEVVTVPPTDKSIRQASLAGVGLIFGGIGVCYSGHRA